jgi:hypothetical protein
MTTSCVGEGEGDLVAALGNEQAEKANNKKNTSMCSERFLKIL